MLIEAPRKSVERRPNRWVTVGSPQQSNDKKPAVKWTGTATAASWPYEPAVYGWVTERKEINSADSRATVHKAALTNMETALAAASKRSVEIAPDPRLEAGDVIVMVVVSSSSDLMASSKLIFSWLVSCAGSAALAGAAATARKSETARQSIPTRLVAGLCLRAR